MRTKHVFITMALYLLALTAATPAEIITVGQDGGANFSVIQEAINAATDGDEIVVSPGTYLENINFSGKNIILRSSDPNDDAVVAATVIDGNQSGSVVTFAGAEGTACVLSGFTITNGSGTVDRFDRGTGGGIYGIGTLATIQRNAITSNTASFYGGGMISCRGTVQYNTISGNTAGWGGGGAAYGNATYLGNAILNNTAEREGGGLFWCSGVIQDNTISDNSAILSGGGLFWCQNGEILGNTISGNSAGDNDGGGMYNCSGGTIRNNFIYNNLTTGNGGGMAGCSGAAIQNNTIWGNSAVLGGGMADCFNVIQNCIIWGNTPDQLYDSRAPTYSCIENWPNTDDGNINADPRFFSAHTGDFRLLFISPCIDAGSYIEGLTVDFEGHPRHFNGTDEVRGDGSDYDIGADEYYWTIHDFNPPLQPLNLAPQEGSLVLPAAVNLQCSAFSDIDPSDWHQFTQWQVTRARLGDGAPDFSIPVFDSGADHRQLTSTTIPREALYASAVHYWRVRHASQRPAWSGYASWSDWSAPTSFVVDESPPLRVPDDYASIQAAIDDAINGDEIIVSTGTYVENIHFGGKNIILRSTAPEDNDTVSSTIIDGNQAGSVVTFSGGEDPDCVLAGFTITNGGGGGSGGGIFGNGASATIQYNTITGNSAIIGGGLRGCHGTIQYNTISANTAGQGGGLQDCHGIIRGNVISANSAEGSGGGLRNCRGTIEGNTISGNAAGALGGGLYHCDGTIQENTISSNTAQQGAGLMICGGTIQNNTISGNSAEFYGGGLLVCAGEIQNNAISNNSAGLHGGGLYRCNGRIQNNAISSNSAGEGGGGLHQCSGAIQNNTISSNTAQMGGGLFDCVAEISNCIVWGNSGDQLANSTTPTFSCIENWAGGGEGNITSAPLFVDAANGDYHLLPDSPCIDAGQFIDGVWWDFEWQYRAIDGSPEARGDGSDYDIGADEYFDAAGAEANYGCFVDRQYADFLNRVPEPGGHQFYVDMLGYGLYSPEQTVENFIRSPEFAAYNGFIARCYFAIFNDNSQDDYTSTGYRIPDYDGMLYWNNTMKDVLASSGTFVEANLAVIAGFTNSPEWQLRIGGLTDAEFIEFLYTHILGRASEPAGHAYHLDNLARGETTREDLIRQFIVSPEAVNKYASHTYVVMAYLGLLTRGAEPDGFVYHVQRLESGAADSASLLAGFIYAPEYINRLAALSCTFPLE